MDQSLFAQWCGWLAIAAISLVGAWFSAVLANLGYGNVAHLGTAIGVVVASRALACMIVHRDYLD